MIIAGCVSIAFLQGMDNRDTTVVVHGINVQIFQGSIIKSDNQADVFVVGKFSQERLQPMFTYETMLDYAERPIGSVAIGNELYVKHADDESGSDGESSDYYFAAFCFQKQNRLRNKAIKQTIKSKVFQVAEPRIREVMYLDEDKGKIVAGPWYCEFKQDVRDQNLLWQIDKKGDAAQKMALEDLALCYNTILNSVIKKYKSVAIEELGTDVGVSSKEAAQVMATTVIDFLKNSAKNGGDNMLEKIILCVRKKSAYERYVELFKTVS